jgi:Ala-tRNA(Pro) deacylase
MITSEQEFLAYLEDNHFSYQRIEHPAVFTCSEAELHRPAVPASSTKNLFLCDKKARRFFLAVTSCEKTLRLESLSNQMGIPHLRFASEQNLYRLLGVTRGAVTMMGLANDIEHRVDLWMDAEVWQADHFLSHPLVNTATLVISKEELERFFSLTGHTLHFFQNQENP